MAHHFFLSAPIDPGKPAVLEGENAHHAIRVLRIRIGETISLADNSGRGYLAEVTGVRDGRVIAVIRTALPSPEPQVQVTLYQGWPRRDKMDAIIEKCTELGVARIVVVTTERSIPRPDRETCNRRLHRWQQKACAAARQSRRHVIPAVAGPLELEAALASYPPGRLFLVPWEEEAASSLRAALDAACNERTAGGPAPGGIFAADPAGITAAAAGRVREVALLIGPEGGLSRAEVALARDYGGLTVTLGPRILRTETAGPACLAAIMYALGEMG